MVTLSYKEFCKNQRQLQKSEKLKATKKCLKMIY